jgi:hypothetical protein
MQGFGTPWQPQLQNATTLSDELAAQTPVTSSSSRCATLIAMVCVPIIRFGNIDGEGRRGSVAM